MRTGCTREKRGGAKWSDQFIVRRALPTECQRAKLVVLQPNKRLLVKDQSGRRLRATVRIKPCLQIKNRAQPPAQILSSS